MEYSYNNKYKSWNPNNNKYDSEDEDTDELGNSQYLDDLMSDKIVGHEDQVMLTKESYKSMSASMNESINIDNPTPSWFYSVYTNYKYKVYLHSICIKPWLLFCVYIVSTKAHLMLYTYYHWYKYLYKCLYVEKFYIISTNTSLWLCSYCYLYVHLY